MNETRKQASWGEMKVVGLGALNMDHLYRVPQLLSDGEVAIEQAVSQPGGSAANTVFALARLGVEAGFVGAVGDDDEGWQVLRDFSRVGVDASCIRIKAGARTGMALCLVGEEGQRAIYVLAGANDLLDRGDVDLEYLGQADLLHLSSFVGEGQFQLQRELLPELPPGLKVSLAPGEIYVSRGFEALVPFLRRTDILLLNRRELKLLTGEDPEKGARQCLEEGCRLVVVTLGGQQGGLACYLADGERALTLQARTIGGLKAMDTTGAGDAFAAGLLYGLLKGRSLEECGVLGEAVARRSIAEVGARAGLPTLSQLRRDFHDATGLKLQPGPTA